MSKTKWLTVAAVVLVSNTAFVTLASVWRIATADDSPVAASEQDAKAAPNDETNLLVELPPSVPGLGGEATSSSLMDRESGESAVVDTPPRAEVTSASGMDRIEVPDELPEVPSLDRSEQFDNDPLMQELRSLFENRDNAPRLETRTPSVKSDRSADYFESIDNRLKTVRLLTMAAQSIATEAETLSKKQASSTDVDELLNMSSQLRSIAAKLLVKQP